MKNRSPDADDIERAVYDGMQDLRAVPPARPAVRARGNRGKSPNPAKTRRKKK